MLLDEDGHIVWACSYQLWGKPIQEIEHSQIQQNLRYQGQYLDRETGLHYNTFRYYDPDIGRFTQPDPIGLLGGFNLYQYAPNGLTWIDPWGLSSELPNEAIVCRGGACLADSFKNGSGVSIDDNGKLTGVSVNSSKNKSLAQLTEGIPHNKVGVTTVGSVRAAGGDVIASPTKNNPNHAALSGISAEQAEALMTPTQKKPSAKQKLKSKGNC